MLEPNGISAGIATFVATSILLAFMYFSNNERFSLTFTKLDNLLYKKLYYPIYKTITYIFVIMFVFLLYSPFMAEYPKKITFYVCDTSFVECVIPEDPRNMLFYNIPYPFSRERFRKINPLTGLDDYNDRRKYSRFILDMEYRFKNHPYSF